MNTFAPFEKPAYADLSLPRRSRPQRSSSDSYSPFAPHAEPERSDEALQAAWDKLYRARAILEREQAHLRDDRLQLQAEAEALLAREQVVSEREERLRLIDLQAELERQDAEELQSEAEGRSALAKLTRAPFEMARSVFGQKR